MRQLYSCCVSVSIYLLSRADVRLYLCWTLTSNCLLSILRMNRWMNTTRQGMCSGSRLYQYCVLPPQMGVQVGFVIDKVAVGRDVGVLHLSSTSIIPPTLSTVFHLRSVDAVWPYQSTVAHINNFAPLATDKFCMSRSWIEHGLLM